MSILDALNPAQRQGAEAVDGPVLVLAGAGSGKTRVLTYRIAHLIQELGVSPWSILAVTFTNKAAGEMRQRVDQLAGERARRLWMGTFHSICARLLRMEAPALELDPNFTIYDEDDRRSLLKKVLEAQRIDPQTLAPRAAAAQISRAKNAMIDAQAFSRQGGQSPVLRRLSEVYRQYEEELRSNHALDFDDLLVEAVQRLQAHPEVLSRYQERFRYVLVDEYQDTNRPQYLLCRVLAEKHRNLCVVGDDDQSIYQFRGADIRNILDFEQDYPEARVVRLEQNYRSTGRILAAANAVIRHNVGRKGKELWTEAAAGELIEVVECESDRCEARFVVSTMRRLTTSAGQRPGDMAVLYRTNAQSRALEEELQRSGMPYCIVGGTRFYERKEIKDLLAYLRLLVNPADSATLLRVINVPRRGLGDTSLERLQAWAAEHHLPLLAALDHLDDMPGFTGKVRASALEFRDLVRRLAAGLDHTELPEIGLRVYEDSGYRHMLESDKTPESEARRQYVEQLLAFMTEFATTREEPTLSAFLEEVALMSPVDEASEAGRVITLMTLHSAKGLEYPVVFMCGMEENLFPTSRAVEESHTDPHAIEEERRLCYVGVTRARQRLYLTHASRRFAYGSMISAVPSRFLEELPAEVVVHREETEFTGARARQRPTPPLRPPSSATVTRPLTGSRPASTGVHYEYDTPPRRMEGFDQFVEQDSFLAVGQWVRHPTWGRGQIVAREGHGADMKLSIRFGGQRVKKVVAAYAQLEPDM